MKATVRSGAITYVGFDPSNNGSWVVEDKGDWTYVIYQEHEFCRTISGYVVKQPDGKYRAFNLAETYSEFFDDKHDAIAFVKKKYEEEA